ncbi:MAG: hypothetical protein AAB455_01170 [Patescibacteria group bacterium]
MQLRRSGIIVSLALAFILIDFSFIQAAWREPLAAPPYCSGPDCSLVPINAGPTDQVKNGSFGISSPNALTGWRIFSTSKSGVGPSPGGDWSTNVDPTAALDVNGQIRLRDGTPGDDAGKTLASDAVGVTSWQSLPSSISSFSPGFGVIITNPTPTDSNVYVAIDPTKIQRQLSNGCAPNQAITEVQESGAVECGAFVSSITSVANSGLAGGGIGSVSFSIQPGAGLNISSNQIRVANQVSGSGLKFSSNQLKFDDFQCGTGAGTVGQYWQYNNGSWSCYNLESQVRPGGSIMLLKTRLIDGNPPSCPNTASGQWADLGVSREYTSSNGDRNLIRTCWRNVNATPSNNRDCQVMYFRQSNLHSPFSPPNCPFSWEALPLSVEYSYGGTVSTINNVRTCFKCY